MSQPACPYCGSTNISCEFVDIGVGEIQCTPYGCEDCHAVQINPYDESDRPDEEEKRIGWWKPPTQDCSHHQG